MITTPAGLRMNRWFRLISFVRPHRAFLILSLGLIASLNSPIGWATTYAEQLGWPEGARVLIVHVDDAGMSHESNQGALQAIRDGAANSVSVMMPTPWVPEFVRILEANPEIDAGLHLTLTAEWIDYRWGPLSGKPTVGTLVDKEGALWPTVEDVVQHGSVEHVAAEIGAQLTRARELGFEPTHFDSHMGTLFATPEFLATYIELGVRHKIPVMFPGGHNFYAQQDYGERAAAEAIATGRYIWDQGLPVLDDLHNSSYGWARAEKVERYVDAIVNLKPGVTMMIMHCSTESENFSHISTSGPTRVGDLEAMLSAEVAEALKSENIVLTTWRELMLRRQAVKP
ncbi:MAG: putative glycoside hydrolase/deacetylase ChbG (UPF0249 family) [Limisphaerales bacterium]|jgi:predicted glycoside hydrolase/deacetylase ChbG (UPF0249 family)